MIIIKSEQAIPLKPGSRIFIYGAAAVFDKSVVFYNYEQIKKEKQNVKNQIKKNGRKKEPDI